MQRQVFSAFLLSVAVLYAPPAAAQPAHLAAFSASCGANARVFLRHDEDVAGFGAEFCACLTDSLSDISEADAAMLIRDIESTATPAERDAHAGYGVLQSRAEAAVEICAGSLAEREAGLSTAPGPTAMDNLAEQCVQSVTMAAMLQNPPQGATAARIEMCGCLVTTLKDQLSAEETGLLAREIAGTLASEERATFPGMAALGKKAEDAFGQCQVRIGVRVSS